mgnify:FL=1
MRILIEGYPYDAAEVQDVLTGLDFLENVNHKVVVNYVGYMYNPHIQDCVFILPKVLVDKEGKAFSKYDPAHIINIEKSEDLEEEERKFIYEFAVWIYRALYVFNQHNPDNEIIYYKQMSQVGSHHRHMTNTYLEVLLALVEFNKKNQNFFMTILKNLHSGINKINWTRTIAHSQAIVHDNSPIYLNPVNKKRQINFDEELLVIFFSILHYINEKYGFPVNISFGFELITGAKFKNYLSGYGQVRLRQIKYKYFSDKALYLWELCYAFFDKSHNISVASDLQEYLIAKNFNIVFEAIIDELVGDKKEDLPDGLKDQADGKRVDHIYSYKGLTTAGTDDKSIYYIGDSKYYQLKNEVTDESVYKQYTYARNVIQWNLDIFLNPDQKNEKWRKRTPMYRDEETEGYNIVPNFFISARMDEQLSYADNIYETDKEKTTFISKQFENRLFDRDTLLIYHYDVNFLYVVSLYAQDNDSAKHEWKEKVRGIFRDKIQQMLASSFDFYAMTAHPGVDARQYIQEHFQYVLGKMYKPYPNPDYFSLALDKQDKYTEENKELLKELSKHFFVEKITIGKDPEKKLEKVVAAAKEQGIISEDVGNSKVLVVVDIQNSNWDNFDNMEAIYIGMETAEKSFEYYHEFADVDYILLTHRDERTYLFKTHGKPRMQNEKPQNALGRSFKKASEGEQLMWPDMLHMVFSITKKDLVDDYNLSLERINKTATLTADGKPDYYSPRVVKLADVVYKPKAKEKE